MENFDLTQRVKGLRSRKGYSQEQLANVAGLSLRTVQRIENGETVPRGDTLRRLAVALEVSPDEVIDWQVQEDKNILRVLILSQLGFLAFPLLGIIIPMAIWILKKDKVRYVDETGKAILNFQITWAMALFGCYALIMASLFFHIGFFPRAGILPVIGFLYAFNLVVILISLYKNQAGRRMRLIPSISFLR